MLREWQVSGVYYIKRTCERPILLHKCHQPVSKCFHLLSSRWLVFRQTTGFPSFWRFSVKWLDFQSVQTGATGNQVIWRKNVKMMENQPFDGKPVIDLGADGSTYCVCVHAKAVCNLFSPSSSIWHNRVRIKEDPKKPDFTAVLRQQYIEQVIKKWIEATRRLCFNTLNHQLLRLHPYNIIVWKKNATSYSSAVCCANGAEL